LKAATFVSNDVTRFFNQRFNFIESRLSVFHIRPNPLKGGLRRRKFIVTIR
jgi:hypothetical protein